MDQETVDKFSSKLVGKVVITDTSALLISGVNLLKHIEKCELVIPAVVVQELEAKRSHPTLGILARQWINLLESLRLAHGLGLSKGVDLNDNGVTIRVEPNHSKQASLPPHLQDGSVDSTILAVAKNLDNDPEILPSVIILSNDIPMRLHATLDLEMDAIEYSVANIEGTRLHSGSAAPVLSQKDYLAAGFESKRGNAKSESFVQDLVVEKGLGSHALIQVFIEGETPATHQLLFENGSISEVSRKLESSRIVGKTVEQDVALHYLKKSPDELPIVSIGGSAGTGKTLLTVATAIEAVKAHQYQKIVVFRSLHEMGVGQEMGFLPGDVADKMGPWSGAVGDALDVIAERRKPAKKNEGPMAVEDRKKIAEKLAETIEVSPITYLRGRSLTNSFIILDEAQNFSFTELLNIISRVGEGSKLVLLFDSHQVDNRWLQTGARAEIWSVINHLKDQDLFAHITLQRTERSRVAELASRILEAGV